LGFPDQPQPVFVIQVLVSSVLLREAVKPEVANTLAVSLLALLVSTLLAWWAARLALRPLARISRQIDLIATGEPAQDEEMRRSSSGEYAVVQEKLRLLGEQVRGAREGVTQLRGSVEQLLERLEDAILMAGADGVVRIASPAAERMLGRPKDEILGRPLAELLPPESPAGRVLASTLESGISLTDVPVDWVLHGAAARVLLNATALPGGAGCILRLRDAEGRQLLESQLNLSQRLTAINRLTGGVAHEIKNPLNSIALRLELLKAKFLPQAPESKPEIDIIAQEITRLDRVVRTFLDFTRPLELQLREVDLAGLAAGVLALVRPEAERAGIQVEYSARIVPVRVRGDEDLLKQAVLNVVRNALEAMPGGGRLSVLVAYTGRDALVAVSDTGPGIAPENREKIFQLYYSTKKNGSGIGLAMTYRAIQLHGGSIEVESEPGAGAVFRLRLPLQWAGGPK
jgi:signal transduction histidine kinase